MNRRSLLVALLVVSTAAFVVGVGVERSSGDSHDEPAAAAESRDAAETGEEHGAEGDEAEASEAGAEAHSKEAAAETDENEEESVLGVDLEATPFVVLAAAVSLGLALAVWLRPEWLLLLGLVATAMVAFAALDVREIVHQIDEDNGGLALLAGVVALLHLAAAAIALSMARAPAVAPRDSLA